MGITNRIQHAWNAFMNKDPTINPGQSYGYRPDRIRLTRGNERTIVTSIFNRIALDVSLIDIAHVKLDINGRYLETINSSLNNCLSLEANIDQTGRAFIQDAVMSMLDEGTVALVPIDIELNGSIDSTYDITSIRTGKILDWFPEHIRVRVYNDRTGRKEDVIVPKKNAAILENPLYAVINEPNSTMQRLIRKLNILDAIDEQSGSGKLDLIIQLPYTVKTESRRNQAERRRKDIETQLTGSKYGIAYTDATEHITQLNRSVDNNLMSQIEYLTSMLYSQLGITKEIMDGTADEKTFLNYYNRSINPFIVVLVDEMKRKFLTKDERASGYSIMSFRDPFTLVTISDLSEAVDKLTRNEVMSSNEVRQKIGMKPSKDPKADELRNKNINSPTSPVGNIELKQNNEEEDQNERI